MAATGASKVTLCLTIESAKNLPKMKSAAYQFGDFTKKIIGAKKGYIDPYVMVSFVDMPARTKQSFKSQTERWNYSPKWDFTFECVVESEDSSVRCELEVYHQDSPEASRKAAGTAYTFTSSTPMNRSINLPLTLAAEAVQKKSDLPTLFFVLKRFDVSPLPSAAVGSAARLPSFVGRSGTVLAASSGAAPASSSASGGGDFTPPPLLAAPSIVFTAAEGKSSVIFESTKERPSGFVSARTSKALELFNHKHSVRPTAAATVPLADWAQALRPPLADDGYTYSVLVKGGTRCMLGWAPIAWQPKQDPSLNAWLLGYFINLFDGIAVGNPQAERVKCAGPEPDDDWAIGPAEPNEVFTIKSQFNPNTGTIAFSLNGAPLDVIFKQVSGLQPLIPTFGFFANEDPSIELSLPY